MDHTDIEKQILKRIKSYKTQIEELRGKIIMENLNLDRIRGMNKDGR